MSDYPDYPLFAVLKDNIVVDGGFGGADEIVYSIIPPNTKTYNKDEYTFVLMTEENSPAQVGSVYKNGKFI